MPETTYYSQDQFKVILPFLKGIIPRWLVLGGPADGNEAQCARSLWPGIKVMGAEPNADMVAWQHAHGWPEDCHLINAALAAGPGEVLLAVGQPNPRGASVDPWSVLGNTGNPDAEIRRVSAISIDSLDVLHGPFDECVVWLDIEGSEHQALLGASRLLERRAAILFNLELQSRVPGLVVGVERLMAEHGYEQIHEWNASDECRDRIYVRRP